MTIAGKYFSRRDGLRDYIEEGPLLPALDEFANELVEADSGVLEVRWSLRS